MKIRSCHFAWAKPFKALYSVGKFQTIYHYPQPQTLYNLTSDYIRLLVPLYNAIDKLIFFFRFLKHVTLFLTSDSCSCCFLFLEYCFHTFYMTNFYLYFHISPLIVDLSETFPNHLI